MWNPFSFRTTEQQRSGTNTIFCVFLSAEVKQWGCLTVWRQTCYAVRAAMPTRSQNEKQTQINTLRLSLKQLNILDSVHVKGSSAARVKKLFSPCVIISHMLTTFTTLQINENRNKHHITLHGTASVRSSLQCLMLKVPPDWGNGILQASWGERLSSLLHLLLPAGSKTHGSFLKKNKETKIITM